MCISTIRTGTHGVSTNGATAHFMFFNIHLCGAPVNLLSYSQQWQGVCFSFCQIDYLRSSPLSVDPICPQPSSSRTCNKIIMTGANNYKRNI